MERKYLALISLVVIIIALVGGYYAYGSYLNNKYDESFKTQYYYGIKTDEAYNNTEKISEKIGNKTYSNESDFNKLKKQYLESCDKTIDYGTKMVEYEKQMVNFADSEIEKKYANLLLQINQKFLDLMKIEKQKVELMTFKSNSTNQKKIDELSTESDKLGTEMDELNEKKDEIKLINSEFNQRIENLRKEAETVIN